MNKVFSLASALALTFVLLVLPAAADTSSFSDQPLPVSTATDSATISSVGFHVYNQILSSSSSRTFFAVSRNSSSCYALVCDGKLVFATPDSNSTVRVDYTGNTYNNGTNYTLSSFDESSQLYYYQTSVSGSDKEFLVPSYFTLSSGLSALRSYLNDSAIDVPDKSYVDIPAGYVAVLYVKNPSQWSAGALRCNFPFSSYPNAPYWGNTGQSYKFFDSRPVFSEQTLFPLSGMSTIGWNKGGSFGVGGQTTYAIGEISFGPSYNWCTIYNPFVTFDSNATNPRYNGSIRVHANIAEAYLYPVAQLLGSDGWESRSLDDWENPYVGAAPDQDNGYWSWTEPSGDPEDPPTIVIPPEGGSNEAPVEVTNQSLLSQIIGILSNLLSEIAGLFSFAFEAITGLVSLAGGFFVVLGGIFGWLPSEIVTLIVSSLGLIVTVGVLKSFL